MIGFRSTATAAKQTQRKTVQLTKKCEEHDKALYTSKQDARRALVGQLASKSVRVYACDEHPGQFHVTKDWKHKRKVTTGQNG